MDAPLRPMVHGTTPYLHCHGTFYAGAHQMLWTGSSQNEKQPAKCGFWGFGSLDLSVFRGQAGDSRCAWKLLAFRPLHCLHDGWNAWRRTMTKRGRLAWWCSRYCRFIWINWTNQCQTQKALRIASSTICMWAKRTESLAFTLAHCHRLAFHCHHLLVCTWSHVHVLFSLSH